MYRNLLLLICILITWGCAKQAVNPSTAPVTKTDTTKTVTPPVATTPTNPAGIYTTIGGSTPYWIMAMHNTNLSTYEAVYTHNTVATDAAGNVFILFTYINKLNLDPLGSVLTGNEYQATLAKYSPAGKLLWSKQFSRDATSFVVVQFITTDGLGNVVCNLSFAGGQPLHIDNYTYNFLETSTDPHSAIIKFDTAGNLSWVTETSGRISSLAADVAGNVYCAAPGAFGIVGQNKPEFDFFTNDTNINISTNHSFWIKLDANGKYVMASYGAPAANNPISTLDQTSQVSIVVDKDQNVYVSSYEFLSNTKNAPLIGSPFSSGIYISKFDKTGKWVWFKGYDGKLNPNLYYPYYGIKIDNTNGIYMYGLLSRYTTAGTAYGINKVDFNGNDVWSKTITGATLPYTKLSLVTDQDKLIAVTESMTDPSIKTLLEYTNRALVLNAFNADGSAAYTKTIKGYNGVSDFITAYDISSDNNGTLNILGYVIGSMNVFNSSADPKVILADNTSSLYLAHIHDAP